MLPDSKRRFSGRTEDYSRYRPRYPASVVEVLRDGMGFDSTWIVADVGSGTGFSTELFLDSGNIVFAVEPNLEMRRAAESVLGGRAGFNSVPGSAEQTGLGPASIDVVVAGQAFHWFDPRGSAEEFARILRDPKWLVLFWNRRHTDTTDFLREYESLLLRYGTDYVAVRHERVDGVLDAFFGGPFMRRSLPNEQRFDYVGLRGRTLSASYTPPRGHPDHVPMLGALERLFDRHQEEGRVRMTYDTDVFVGKLRAET